MGAGAVLDLGKQPRQSHEDGKKGKRRRQAGHNARFVKCSRYSCRASGGWAGRFIEGTMWPGFAGGSACTARLGRFGGLALTLPFPGHFGKVSRGGNRPTAQLSTAVRQSGGLQRALPQRFAPILRRGDNGAISLSPRWAPRATRRQQTYPGPRFHPLITTLRGAVLAPWGRG